MVLHGKKQSGIGNYPISFKDYNYIGDRATAIVNKHSFILKSNYTSNNFLEINTKNKTLPSYRIKVEGIDTITNGILRYMIDSIVYIDILQDGEYEIPEAKLTEVATYSGWRLSQGVSKDMNVTVTVLPKEGTENSLCLDGINDFGKVTGLPIYKDYTVVANYQRLSKKENNQDSPILSKSKVQGAGAFLFNFLDANSRQATYSFGQNNNLTEKVDDSKKSIYYQSKYINNGNDIIAGTAIDYEDMWLGTYRDNTANYFNGAFYSSMVFPYSMSEFLIERQLKKYKLGTLYPNMVEWRPVVSSNSEYESILYFNTADNKSMVVGQYYPSDTSIQISLKPKAGDKVNKITINGKEPIFLNNTDKIYRYRYNFDGKSPQQIKLKLGIDENLVQFNPIINSNAEYSELKFYYRSVEYPNVSSVEAVIGDYYPIDGKLLIRVFPNSLDEVSKISVNEKLYSVTYNKENSYYQVMIPIFELKSPQKIYITIDEYIRYEDIPQPYPAFFYYNNKDTKKDYTWGDKIKVGSIMNVRSVYNLLEYLYTINAYIINGERLGLSALKAKDIVVTKDLAISSSVIYKLDNNEPKCVLSPNKLRIPNSSYRLLGYIPDISGHGNHGKVNNSAYAGMSGANGYFQNWNTYFYSGREGTTYTKTDSKIWAKTTIYNDGIASISTFNFTDKIPSYKVKIETIGNSVIGTPSTVSYYYIDETGNRTFVMYNKSGTYTLPVSHNDLSIATASVGFWVNGEATIEQIGEYEGAFCLDGVDDFINVPTLSSGGKQVLVKINWNTEFYNRFIADFRKVEGDTNYILNDFNASSNSLAYQNTNKTYIDGILNNNIKTLELKGVTHNIVGQFIKANSSPYIGARTGNGDNMTMSLYEFMLFDEISTGDNIKKLNEYIGIEGNFIEWNPNITCNVSNYGVVPRIRKSDSTIIDLVKGNIYSTSITGNLILDIVPPNKLLDEVSNVIIDGKSYTPIRNSNGDYYRVEIPLEFPNEINITIDEYIRYENIEQPYPIFLNYIDKETNKAYTWGDKVKVDSILKISGYKNLFENGDTFLGGSNGYSVNGSSELIPLGTLLTSEILVNKINTGVRSSVIWNLDTPKPLFAYDPSIINNIGLKNLGYLPDITGQGRHLLLNNFAYSKMSGKNGYLFNFDIVNIKVTKISSTEDTLIIKRINSDADRWLVGLGKVAENFDIQISWDGSYEYILAYVKGGTILDSFIISKNSWINIPVRDDIDYDNLYIIAAVGNTNYGNVTIKQKAYYDGALCFDGVDDYGNIPTLISPGAKCLIMKFNNQSDGKIIYDQRKSALENDQHYFAIYTGHDLIAYNYRNNGGVTYIDNIINNNLQCYQLMNITSVVTICNENAAPENTVSPVIGMGGSQNYQAKFAMYRTMLLPDIPSDKDRTKINDWAGIEPKIELPSYYWDAYGKNNNNVDKGFIKDQVSLQLNNDNSNNNSLENFNFGYEGMSGYNGYPVIFGIGKTWQQGRTNEDNFQIEYYPTYVKLTKVNFSVAFLYTYIKSNGVINPINNKEIDSYKIRITGLTEDFSIRYQHIDSSGLLAGVSYSKDGVYTIPKSYLLSDSEGRENVWIGWTYSDIKGQGQYDCDITIEILPEYENGIVYDGIDDNSNNTIIPAFTDFTTIIKSENIGNKNNNSCIVRKGISTSTNGGGAFIYDFENLPTNRTNSYWSFGDVRNEIPFNKIGYMTKVSANGIDLNIGTNLDEDGLTVGKWISFRKMVLYKLMLWPKTIDIFSINMIRNMFEKDEIIDLSNKLFKNNS